MLHKINTVRYYIDELLKAVREGNVDAMRTNNFAAENVLNELFSDLERYRKEMAEIKDKLQQAKDLMKEKL